LRAGCSFQFSSSSTPSATICSPKGARRLYALSILVESWSTARSRNWAGLSARPRAARALSRGERDFSRGLSRGERAFCLSRGLSRGERDLSGRGLPRGERGLHLFATLGSEDSDGSDGSDDNEGSDGIIGRDFVNEEPGLLAASLACTCSTAGSSSSSSSKISVTCRARGLRGGVEGAAPASAGAVEDTTSSSARIADRSEESKEQEPRARSLSAPAPVTLGGEDIGAMPPSAANVPSVSFGCTSSYPGNLVAPLLAWFGGATILVWICCPCWSRGSFVEQAPIQTSIKRQVKRTPARSSGATLYTTHLRSASPNRAPSLLCTIAKSRSIHTYCTSRYAARQYTHL
jgi:hypothetical protein